MALRQRKPTSPGRRFQTVSDFADITKTLPEKSLLDSKPKTGGRNNYGRKTSRHRGGGHKQQYRIIDFKRNKDAIPARVAAIEYDPNRTCRIALLHYLDGEKRYILAPNGLKVDDMVESRSQGRHPHRQRAADALHPDRFHGPQRRAPPRRRRQDGAQRRHGRADRRQRGCLRHACVCPRPRCAASRSTVAPRSASSATPSTNSPRSARPDATAGRASAPRRAVSP